MPVVLVSLVLGLASRDQMTAGFYSVPVLLVALLPTFGMVSETVEAVAALTPLGGRVRTCSGLRPTGASSRQTRWCRWPVTLAWVVAGAACFAALYRRLARDN